MITPKVEVEKLKFSKYSINILHVVEVIFQNVMYGKAKQCEMDIARVS